MRVKLVVVLLLMAAFCSCCGPDEDDNLGPSTELQQVVNRGSFAWVNARMWDQPWMLFHLESAEWREADSIEKLVQYFHDLGVEVGDAGELWDYQVLVSDIQNDSIYLEEDPPEDVFVDQLVRGLGFAESQLTLDFGE